MPNFAALMAAQLSKSKPAATTEGSKYIKHGDVEAAREAAYQKEQAEKEASLRAKEERKRKADQEEAEKNKEREAKRQRIAEKSRQRQKEEDERTERERRKRLGLPEIPPEVEKKDDTPVPEGEEDIEDAALIEKLRGLSEPVRLFGETHVQRLKRYRRLQDPGSVVAPLSKSNDPIPTTLAPVPEIDCKVAAKLPPATDRDARMFVARQLATWFNLVLREWARALANRDADIKQTFAGQAASNSYSQAIVHLKPLFRRLERLTTNASDLPDDLLQPIMDIVLNAQERRYVAANDGYLQLSIGKAAWPIGVTMVGIHERSAREKLHETDKSKAHIMSDESTRKILQSIKRCLSFAQTRWPPADIGQLMG